EGWADMSEQVYIPGGGVHSTNAFDFECASQISAEQYVAAIEVEVATGVHGVFPLPMGMTQERRVIGAVTEAESNPPTGSKATPT
ncbi:hypothetical protein THAOC_09271, partial [Thalassiosira oceanica]